MADPSPEEVVGQASAELKAELASAQPSRFNRFKVNVSHIVNKCTFGAYGTNKNAVQDCDSTEACPGLNK